MLSKVNKGRRGVWTIILAIVVIVAGTVLVPAGVEAVPQQEIRCVTEGNVTTCTGVGPEVFPCRVLPFKMMRVYWPDSSTSSYRFEVPSNGSYSTLWVSHEATDRQVTYYGWVRLFFRNGKAIRCRQSGPPGEETVNLWYQKVVWYKF